MAEPRMLVVPERDLTFIRIDHQTGLQFGAIEFVIGCPFTVRSADAEYDLDPESRAGLGPLLALYPSSLTAAAVSAEATLQLEFDSGTTLTVPADLRYEAWEVHDDRGWRLICLPGGTGEVAEWGGR